MSYAICTLHYGEKYKETVKYGIRNKQMYCKYHNYPLIDDESVMDLSRKLVWSKIKLLQKYLNKYDYLVWIDADTYITNFDISVSDLVKTMSPYVMMYERDPYGWVNDGFMVLKNHPFCHAILSECYLHLDQICDEQGSLDYLYRTNWKRAQHYINVIPHNTGYNQYWFSWVQGNFLIHFPGCHEPELKKDTMDFMMNRFCPYKRDDESDEEAKNRIKSIPEFIRIEYKKSCEKGKCLPLEVYR